MNHWRSTLEPLLPLRVIFDVQETHERLGTHRDVRGHVPLGARRVSARVRREHHRTRPRDCGAPRAAIFSGVSHPSHPHRHRMLAALGRADRTVLTATLPDFTRGVRLDPISAARRRHALHEANSIPRMLAEQHETLVLDTMGHPGTPDPLSWVADGSHPVSPGYGRMARELVRLLCTRGLSITLPPVPRAADSAGGTS